MSDQSGSGDGTVDPQPRIGDAERDRAVAALREHHAAGRIDAAEFEDRTKSALSAKTQADLDPLFADLPESGQSSAASGSAAWPSYGQGPSGSDADTATAVPADPAPYEPAQPQNAEVQPAPRPERELDRRSGGSRYAVAGVVTSVIWAATLIVLFATGWHLWWLILIPAFLSGIVWMTFGPSAHARRRDDRVARRDDRALRRDERRGRRTLGD